MFEYVADGCEVVCPGINTMMRIWYAITNLQTAKWTCLAPVLNA